VRDGLRAGLELALFRDRRGRKSAQPRLSRDQKQRE